MASSNRAGTKGKWYVFISLFLIFSTLIGFQCLQNIQSRPHERVPVRREVRQTGKLDQFSTVSLAMMMMMMMMTTTPPHDKSRQERTLIQQNAKTFPLQNPLPRSQPLPRKPRAPPGRNNWCWSRQASLPFTISFDINLC
jgi:hypothetical protein